MSLSHLECTLAYDMENVFRTVQFIQQHLLNKEFIFSVVWIAFLSAVLDSVYLGCTAALSILLIDRMT